MQMSVASLLPADSQGMIVSFNYALQVYFVKKRILGIMRPFIRTLEVCILIQLIQ
jgi:hypothetical protein